MKHFDTYLFWDFHSVLLPDRFPDQISRSSFGVILLSTYTGAPSQMDPMFSANTNTFYILLIFWPFACAVDQFSGVLWALWHRTDTQAVLSVWVRVMTILHPKTWQHFWSSMYRLPALVKELEHAVFQSMQHAYCSQSGYVLHHTPQLGHVLMNRVN